MKVMFYKSHPSKKVCLISEKDPCELLLDHKYQLFDLQFTFSIYNIIVLHFYITFLKELGCNFIEANKRMAIKRRY